jgi:2,4-dienoyl-CoA reductase-like NADH-dependent reductase (Old Yellow Enzyme family)
MSEPGNTSRRDFLGLAAAGSVGASIGIGTLAAGATQAATQSTQQGRAHYKIFSPGRIGAMKLKNRIVRSAAFEGAGDADGFVTEDMIRIHRGYAEGGVGLTLTGYMSVMEYGRKGSHVCASKDRYIPGLAKLAKAVHDAAPGCKIGAEIGHDGSASPITTSGGPPGPARLTNPSGGQWPNRIGPSGIDWRGESGAHAMTVAEIERFCVDMGHATRRLRDAGFDCVEIHGAHHYLINTFLSPFTNRRSDAYGGSLENRVRIVNDMMSEMRRHVGSDFPVIIKLNCDDGASDNGTAGEIDIHNFPALVRAIAATGVDAIDISGGEKMGDPMRMNLGDVKDQSFYEPFANALDVNVPIILGCGNRNVEKLEAILHKDRVDFFCVARPLIREPGLVNRWQEGRGGPGVDCINSNLCFQHLMRTGTPVRCVVLEQMQQAAWEMERMEHLG